MLDRFYTGFADAPQPELMQYCRMENVIPEALLNTDKPKNAMKLQLESAAYHLLQRINKWLNAMICRLTADLEHNGLVQRHLS
jgi:hypothetical protein